MGGKAGFQEKLVAGKVGGGLAFDLQKSQRGVTVGGLQRLLFARPGVL